MSRRRAPQGLASGVSLFPFLSVLACVIGALTLLIATLAVSHVADELSHQQALDRVDTEQRRAREGEALAARLQQSAEDARELARLRLLVQSRIDASASPDEEHLGARQRALAARMSRLRARAEELDDALGRVRAELSTDDPEAIQILPLGSGPPVVPFLVECLATGVRLRAPDGQWSETLAVPGASVEAPFPTFVDEARGTAHARVIFLVRPDGVQTYRAARRFVREANVRDGKLPMPGQGTIDLNRLRGS